MLFLLLVLFVGLLLGKCMLSNWVGLVSQMLEGYMCVHYLYQGAAYMGVPQALPIRGAGLLPARVGVGLAALPALAYLARRGQ